MNSPATRISISLSASRMTLPASVSSSSARFERSFSTGYILRTRSAAYSRVTSWFPASRATASSEWEEELRDTRSVI